MLQYTNAFNVAIDNDAEEVVITFRQNIPKFSASENSEKVIGDDLEDVVSIVMCTSSAKALSDSLNHIIEVTGKPREAMKLKNPKRGAESGSSKKESQK